MRESEITPELTELSKRAEELGFPQDIEGGDYACIKFDRLGWQPQLFGGDMEIQDGRVYFYSTDGFYFEWFLILSFSRCLEWLREKGWRFVGWSDPWPDDENQNLEIEIMQGSEGRWEDAKTHHEAIAKAVVKILKEKK